MNNKIEKWKERNSTTQQKHTLCKQAPISNPRTRSKGTFSKPFTTTCEAEDTMQEAVSMPAREKKKKAERREEKR
jgi:hypothetical protein